MLNIYCPLIFCPIRTISAPKSYSATYEQFRTLLPNSNFHYSNESYPRQTVTDLLPCAFYSYDILSEESDFLFYNGSFVTPFSDEDFDLNLMDFQVNQQGLAMKVSWTHVHPCISSYNVALMDSQGNVLTEKAVDGVEISHGSSSSKNVYVSFDDDLEQCAHYELIIRPLLNVNYSTEDMENLNFRKPVLLFNEPQPPTLFSVASQGKFLILYTRWRFCN